ncbi:hypothetical protein HZB69_03050 [Candidatus Amesbacteria bacterium]|nr:hypothetical protein [Candidatus Amesbacteria bacterium]
MDWTANLAYVVGLITTDGNLSKDGRHLIFVSKELEQIENFKTGLKINNKVGIKTGGYSGSGQCYYIQFSNVAIYNFLLSIGLMPNKTKILGKMDIPDNYFPDFLRGHLDGDGTTYSYWDKRWRSSFMLYMTFISASKEHLKWMKFNIFRLYGISGTLKFSGRSVYHLVFAKIASIKLINIVYYTQVKLFLSRKRFKILQALDIIKKVRRDVVMVAKHA